MEQSTNRVPAGYFDGNPKKPFYINYVAKNRLTGEETPGLHPQDLPEEKRLEIIDRFAAGFGYQRVTDGSQNADAHPPPDKETG